MKSWIDIKESGQQIGHTKRQVENEEGGKQRGWTTKGLDNEKDGQQRGWPAMKVVSHMIYRLLLWQYCQKRGVNFQGSP